MVFKAKSGILWSDLELQGLLEDEDNYVFYEKRKRHIGLHPFHLTDLNAAFNEILFSAINVYDPSLGGQIVAFKNPKLLSPIGSTIHDTCYIHVDIEAEFYIFKPEIGKTVKGLVKKIGTNVVVVLLHRTVNVSIKKPEDEENWPGANVRVGQEVRVKLTDFENNSRIPYFRGYLDESNYLDGCKLDTDNIEAPDIDDFGVFDFEGSKNNKKVKEKKEKNKHFIFKSDSEEDMSEIEETKLSRKRNRDSEEESFKSPKKKKRKNREPDNEENTSKITRKKKKSFNSGTETDDDRTYKAQLQIDKDLLQKCEDYNVKSQKKKKHKKKEIEDGESKYRILAENDTTEEQPIKSRKKKRSSDTEDEKKSKNMIDKSLLNGLENDSETEVEHLQYTKIKGKSKRQKKNNSGNETENEKKSKSHIDKSLLDNLQNGESLQSQSQKLNNTEHFKKQKQAQTSGNETEDEKKSKFKIKLLEAIPPPLPEIKRKKKKRNEAEKVNHSDDHFLVPQTPVHKKKKKSLDDVDLQDTEDELNYKASLKEFIQNFEESSESSYFKVKSEPESETDEKLFKKKKKKLKHQLAQENT